jgi:hypothetical protein
MIVGRPAAKLRVQDLGVSGQRVTTGAMLMVSAA